MNNGRTNGRDDWELLECVSKGGRERKKKKEERERKREEREGGGREGLVFPSFYSTLVLHFCAYSGLQIYAFELVIFSAQ